ncbi:MAG: hypothetical protein V3U54_07700 [Thermodesulfobacteriota bacterium]
MMELLMVLFTISLTVAAGATGILIAATNLQGYWHLPWGRLDFIPY